MQIATHGYGQGDNSYKAAGELAGLIALSNAFYDKMECLPEAKNILAMHRNDLTESRQKLAYFLSGWLGGPRLFSQTYGPIKIPQYHRHFMIGGEERDAWLLCMEKAIALQPYEDSFKTYLLKELRVPAERVKQVSVATNAAKNTNHAGS